MAIERRRARLTDGERTQLDTRGWRDRRGGEWPPVANDSRPADYAHDLARGTIEFNALWRNYSYHRVRIPDGSVVRECNFSQVQPRTAAIVIAPGFGHSLTFIDCNLCDVKIEADWTMHNCNTSQSWIVEAAHPAGDGRTREKRQLVANHPSLLSDVLSEPAGAITARSF